MFIIYLALAVLLILLINIRFKINIQNNIIEILVTVLWVLTIRKKFVIEREKNVLIAIFQVKKGRRKKLVTLADIIKKSRKKEVLPIKKQAIRKVLLFFIKKTIININAKITIGFGSAVLTAQVCGILGVVSTAGGAMSDSKKHHVLIRIKPIFAKPIFLLDAKGIFMLSPANIIVGYILYKKSMRR